MKELFKKWNEISLIKRIVTGLVIGAILGVALPNLTVLTILVMQPLQAQQYQ